MKVLESKVAFVVNGDRQSAAAERAYAFASRLQPELAIDLIFRDDRTARTMLKMFGSIVRSRARTVYVFDMSFAGVIAAIAHRTFFRSKLVVDTGDAIYELARSMGRGPIGLILTRLLQWAAFFFSNVIVTRGSFHAELLAKRGLNAVWIPDGVDLVKFAPRERLDLRKDLGLNGNLIVGLIGSSVWSERLQMCYGWELVEVINILRDQPIMGVLIGDGSGLPKLRARCKEYGIEDKVLFLGRLPFNQLPDYLAVFDLCLSTQTNDLVGRVRTTGKLPLYLAAGKCVLASRVGEAARVLPDEMLVSYEGVKDTRYPEKLVARIMSLFDEANRSNCAARSVEIAQKYFDYDKLVTKVGMLLKNDPSWAL
jgi:glycosyltransferase involved in cell wall biosynthesis